jgi:hypothetical protein
MKYLATWLCSHKPFLAAATSLNDLDQQTIEAWLTWITLLVAVLIAGLIFLAFFIRHLAKHSTRPCQWCMEFIPKKAKMCPHCGKNVG